MGGAANIRVSKRLERRRAAKQAGCPMWTKSLGGITNHAVQRREERALKVDFSFFPADITDLIQKKQATVSDNNEESSNILFSLDVDGVKVRFKVIAVVQGKKVKKVITIINLDESEANENN